MRRLSLTSTAWLPLLALKLIVLRARGIYCSLVQFWYRGRCSLQPTHNRLLGARSARRLRPYLHPHFTFTALFPASPQFGQARERTTPSPPSRAAPTNQPINHSTDQLILRELHPAEESLEAGVIAERVESRFYFEYNQLCCPRLEGFVQ